MAESFSFPISEECLSSFYRLLPLSTIGGHRRRKHSPHAGTFKCASFLSSLPNVSDTATYCLQFKFYRKPDYYLLVFKLQIKPLFSQCYFCSRNQINCCCIIIPSNSVLSSSVHCPSCLVMAP